MDNSITPKQWYLLLTMCLLTAVSLAIPKIATSLNANLTSMQWVVNIYVLFTAMFTILGGRIGDMVGHRRLFITGTVLFIVGSIIAGIAPNEGLLIFGRGIQGIAVGIAYPMTMVIIYSTLPKDRHGLATGIIMGTMGIFLAIGPTLGGVILHYIGWRWILLVNVPLGILTIFLTYLFCKKDSDVVTNLKHLDVPGSILWLFALGVIMLGFNQSQTWGITSSKFFWAIGLGVIALIIMYFVEKKQAEPLVSFSLYKNKLFTQNNYLRAIAQFVFVPNLFFIPIYLQNIAGMSVLKSSAIMLFVTIIVGILAPFIGKYIDKYGVGLFNKIGMAVYALACFMLINLSNNLNLAYLATALILIGIGTGICFVSTTTGALRAVEEKDAGQASGLFFTNAWITGAIGVAVTGAITGVNAIHYLHAQLIKQNIVLIPDQINLLKQTASGIYPVSELANHVPAAMLDNIKAICQSAFTHGFGLSMLTWMVLALMGLVWSLSSRC